MTEIPIERKSKGGVPWWVWLLIGLVIAAVLWWLLTGRDNDRVTPAPAAVTQAELATTEPTDVGQDTAAAGPITDLGTLASSNDREVVGRRVRLTNVPAGEVPADAGFWITGDNGAREYVILHEVRTPSTPIEGKIDVNQGDRLDVTGTVRSASNGVPEDAAIPGPTAPLPAAVKHYIDAESVTKTQ